MHQEQIQNQPPSAAVAVHKRMNSLTGSFPLKSCRKELGTQDRKAVCSEIVHDYHPGNNICNQQGLSACRHLRKKFIRDAELDFVIDITVQS